MSLLGENTIMLKTATECQYSQRVFLEKSILSFWSVPVLNPKTTAISSEINYSLIVVI